MTDSISTDGSPVEAYAQLPAEPELSVVRSLIGARRRILDLGCGTGRIADPLAEAGYDVVAVDESIQMLRRVRQAPTVQSTIENLDLGRSFDAVLLLSHLINAERAPAFLRTVSRHLVDGGLLVAQRLAPGRSWESGSGQVGPVTVELSDVVVEGVRVEGTTTYVFEGQRWRQPWVMWEWTDAQLAHLLDDAGLRIVAIDGAWLTATKR